MKKITYKSSGVNYSKIDPVKKLALMSAMSTAKHLKRNGASEMKDSRGESAYVWKQGNKLMASVIEGLGTKNLVADAMRRITGKTYYDVAAYDTVASIVNDLVSVGASPVAIHAYWAVGKDAWLSDKKQVADLARGWKNACDAAEVSWGGGETPALQGIVMNGTIDLAGSAVGAIKNQNNYLQGKNIRAGDRIIFIKSNGINANGLTLARTIAKKLKKGYAARLPNGTLYGEALLKKSNIYAKVVRDLFKNKVRVHYISNITGHGLRKIMRARQSFTYIIEKIFQSHDVFNFIQKNSELSNYEMYQTFNMGQDYAIFLPKNEVKKALFIIKKNKFTGLDAGYVQRGKKRVKILPLGIEYGEHTLCIR